MAARVVIDPDAHAKIVAAAHEKLLVPVGKAIEVDMVRGVAVDTGETRDTIAFHDDDLASVSVSAGGHWSEVEYGTAPHIEESHGDYSMHNLHTGQYFGERVEHPGT